MWISLYIDMQLIKTFDTAVTVKMDMKMRMRVYVVGWNMDRDLRGMRAGIRVWERFEGKNEWRDVLG